MAWFCRASSYTAANSVLQQRLSGTGYSATQQLWLISGKCSLFYTSSILTVWFGFLFTPLSLFYFTSHATPFPFFLSPLRCELHNELNLLALLQLFSGTLCSSLMSWGSALTGRAAGWDSRRLGFKRGGWRVRRNGQLEESEEKKRREEAKTSMKKEGDFLGLFKIHVDG